MRPRKSMWTVLSVGLVLAVSTVQAADDLPTVEEIEKHMRGIQNNIKNATMRVKHGMSGLSSTDERETGGRPATPAEACCAPNLDRVREKIQGLTRDLERIYRHYSAEGNAEAEAKLEAVREPLKVVAAGMAQFKMAGTTDRAVQALQGLIRPFLDLRAAVDELVECCLESEAEGAGNTGESEVAR